MLISAENSDPIPAPDFNRKLKICLLGYRCNPYSGGQGIYIHYLSKALVEAGHKVDVISGQPYPQLDERVNLIKLPSLNLFESKHHALELRPRHLLSFTDFFEWFSMLTGGFPEPYTFGRRLVQYFDRENPDYDIVHDNQSLCYGVLQLQEKGIPVVTTIHHPITSDLAIALKNTKSWRAKFLIWRWHWFLQMQKKVVPKLDYLTTVSKASRQDIADAFSISTKKIKVIHNGIDTDVFRPQPEVEKKPFRIMATASADIPLKGLDYLLKAVALLVPDLPQLELVVLGKLKEDGQTKKLIGRLKIEKHLRFVSGVTTQELVKLYAEATLVIVPSIYEGFGLPAGEAMACGLPVISTDGGALPEVVGNSGIIVPVQDDRAIAEAIVELLADTEKQGQLSRKARARIVELFSWQSAAQELVKFYSSLPGVREERSVVTNN
jgi:glycosyltransferase involved in cell wall biosynthesis|tara:strand:+ start:6601 stop:7911 length:1311 start_codon:yes stop_codon:yes gene_type:complete